MTEIEYITDPWSRTRGIVRQGICKYFEDSTVKPSHTIRNELHVAAECRQGAGRKLEDQDHTAVSSPLTDISSEEDDCEIDWAEESEPEDEREKEGLAVLHFQEANMAQKQQALQSYREALKQCSENPGSDSHLNAVMTAGMSLNQVKCAQQSMQNQLITTMLHGCLSVLVNSAWQELSCGHLTPPQALIAIANNDLLRRVHIETGPWKSTTCTVGYLQHMKRREGQPWMWPIYLGVKSLKMELVANIEEKRHLGLLCEEEEHLLARLFSEYLAVKFVVTYMLVSEESSSSTPFKIPHKPVEVYSVDVWNTAVAMCQLSDMQIRKCKAARQWLIGQNELLDLSNERLQNGCRELLELPTTNADVELALLDLLEEIRLNGLQRQHLFTEAGFCFLFKILNPCQAALFYACLQTKSQHLMAHFMDWQIWSMLFSFLTNAKDSRWMDKYTSNL